MADFCHAPFLMVYAQEYCAHLGGLLSGVNLLQRAFGGEWLL